MQDSLRYMTSLGSQHKSLYKVNIHFTWHTLYRGTTKCAIKVCVFHSQV
jgi:hypothetical protein